MKPKAIYISLIGRGLSIHAAQETFGYTMAPYGQDPDEHEIVHYDDQQRPVGFKAFSFKPDGRYECFDERIMECLDRHSENQGNGGSAFFKVDEQVIAAARTMTTGAIMPDGGLTDTDWTLLGALEEFSVNGVKVKDSDDAKKWFALAVARFDVTGIKLVRPHDPIDTIRVRISDMLEILESAGIESAADERRNTA